MWNPVRICSVSSSRISVIPSDIFFQNKKPSRNDFAISTLSEHSHIALQGLEALASTMEKDRPTPSDVQIYAEGYLTLLLADLLPSPPADPEKHGGSGTGAEAASLSGCQLHEGIVPGQSLERIRCQPFCPSRIFTEKFHTTFPDYMNSEDLIMPETFCCPQSSP